MEIGDVVDAKIPPGYGVRRLDGKYYPILPGPAICCSPYSAFDDAADFGVWTRERSVYSRDDVDIPAIPLRSDEWIVVEWDLDRRTKTVRGNFSVLTEVGEHRKLESKDGEVLVYRALSGRLYSHRELSVLNKRRKPA